MGKFIDTLSKMKLKTILIFGLFAISFKAISQFKEIQGEYSYLGEFYYESISLLPDGQFKWKVTSEWLRLEAHGNWQLRSDSLILDSSPQKDKLLVWESKYGNTKQMTFYVTNKMKEPINYTLCAITFNNDTVVNKEQFKKTTLNYKIKAFYVIDSKGLHSPTYYVTGRNTNRFDILFETKRTFENESWVIANGLIIPRGADGAIQKYKLTKK